MKSFSIVKTQGIVRSSNNLEKIIRAALEHHDFYPPEFPYTQIVTAQIGVLSFYPTYYRFTPIEKMEERLARIASK